ncbi:protein trapped in endoderm-1 isoform X2 [Pectinophora gossypiella]|uniref:protein trapped in endoderm-1 isoform X2 n=1 Tax=Pectinophora gossypiella TaxID=13191 RepID=UPI00214E6DD4|nr:protein trapped in endoderm-1 isoform X2 [Pectinophora gossypiella]
MEIELEHSTMAPNASFIFPREATILAAVCASIFSVVGVIGNFITTVALLMHPKLRGHVTTMFVLSLCVSDLLFCSINLPLTASRYIKQDWPFGLQLCQLFAFVFYGNEAVSLLSMVAITINRYTLIAYYDMYSQIYTTTKIWIQLLLVWFVSFGLMVPPLLGIWGQLGLDHDTFSCTILPKDGKSPKKYLFVFGFALPCVVIIVSYSCIYWRVRESKRKLEGRSKLSGQTAKEKEEDSRLTTLMLTIFLCFLACFLPLMIMNVAVDSIRYPWLHIIASILAWASSVINPLIYAATNRQYRAAYGNLLKFCKNNPVARRTTWGSRTVGQSSNSPHYAEKRNPLKEKPTKL